MDNNRKATMTVVIGTPINLALYTALAASGAPTWMLWAIIVLTLPYAVLATILITDRVRH